MEKTSRVPLGIRVLLVLVGVVVILAGLFVRALNEETTSVTVDRAELADGSVAVFEPDAEGDWPQWEVAEGSGDAEATVVERTSEMSEPEIVFAGTLAEAQTWAVTRGRTPLFVGTADEADAWIADQEAAADSTLVPNAAISVGAGLVILGLGLGWRRRGE